MDILEMLKQEEQRITGELSGVRGALSALNGVELSNGSPEPKQHRLSQAARLRISQAQKRRWAELKTKKKR